MNSQGTGAKISAVDVAYAPPGHLGEPDAEAEPQAQHKNEERDESEEYAHLVVQPATRGEIKSDSADRMDVSDAEMSERDSEEKIEGKLMLYEPVRGIFLEFLRVFCGDVSLIYALLASGNHIDCLVAVESLVRWTGNVLVAEKLAASPKNVDDPLLGASHADDALVIIDLDSYGDKEKKRLGINSP